MILVKNYISTGFSIEDASKLQNVIEALISSEEKIVLDFSDVKIFTTLFFNNALTKYVMQLTPQGYDEKFVVLNLSEIGKVTYEHSLSNAKDYYNLNSEQQQNQDQIIADTNDLED